MADRTTLARAALERYIASGRGFTGTSAANAIHGGFVIGYAQALADSAPMLQALIVAREFISTDRNALADDNLNEDGLYEAGVAMELADYDQALLQIDAAIRAAQGPVVREEVTA